jgi:hypothetical protein
LDKKFHNSLKIGPNLFLLHFKNKIIFKFVKFVAKKRYDNNFVRPLSFVAVFGSGTGHPGSGMGKNQDPGSGINIPDPQHCNQCCPIKKLKSVFGSTGFIRFST